MKKNDVRIDTDRLHPLLKHRLNKLLKECEKTGPGIIVTEGYRTKEYQDSLYAKGRTKPGKVVTNARGNSYASQHQWGIAFDIAINDKKHLYDEKLIAQVAAIAKKKGISWGGDWKSFKDMPHFYLGKWGSGTTELKLKYGTPNKFMDEWTAKVKRKNGLRLFKNTSKKDVLEKIPYNKKVNVLYKKLWYAKVEYNGAVGFVRKKYLG